MNSKEFISRKSNEMMIFVLGEVLRNRRGGYGVLVLHVRNLAFENVGINGRGKCSSRHRLIELRYCSNTTGTFPGAFKYFWVLFEKDLQSCAVN